jgi:pyruvate dehydrogenase (quinone)
VPQERDLRRAAELLNAGNRVAMLVGAGAMEAAGLVEAVADRLQAGCAKALLGKAVLPDDLPWVTGTIGLLGTLASSEMMRQCDTLFMIGTNFPYAQFLPEDKHVRGVQIDTNPLRLGLRFPNEVNLQGTALDTLELLLPLLDRKHDTAWRSTIVASRAQIAGSAGINPQDVFVALDRRLPERCIVTADAGTSTNWSARHLRMRRGMKWSLSGGLATMGPAVPYAIAAKFAFPDRIPIAVTGDGAMQMSGMNELITLKRYAERWEDPRILFVVANNRDLNQVTWELREESGAPDFPAAQHLPDVSMAAFARFLGFDGIRVERVEELESALDTAFAARGPVVLEVLTDPNTSMFPPHVTTEQIASFGRAMVKGDPEGDCVFVQSVKEVFSGIFPGAGERDTR